MTDEKLIVNTKPVLEPNNDIILDNSIDISEMVRDNPPKIEWIIPDLLPCDITAMLTGKGGSGKTFWILDLMVSIACGVNFLGKSEWKPRSPEKVICVFGEETKDIIHRRFKKIVKYKKLSGEQLKLLSDNMIIYSSHGKNPAFLKNGEDSDFYKNLVSKIEHIEPILVIFDPVSRFYKEDENDNTKATIFIEKLEQLKTHKTLNEKKKTSILIAHHTNKGTANNQSSSRGASAFVDGVRWQCLLNRNEKNLLGDDIEPKNRNLVSMTIPKSNHLKYGVNDITLKVLDDEENNNCGGVLTECDREAEEALIHGDSQEYVRRLSEEKDKPKRTFKKQKAIY